MTILEKYSRKSPMVLHVPMQRQTFEESGCFEVGTYLKREMSTSDPAFHSHSSRTSPGPTPAVPGCPGEGAGEGTAEEETWPCQQRGDGCTYCGEGVLCGQCVCGGGVWGAVSGRSVLPCPLGYKGKKLLWLWLLQNGPRVEEAGSLK